MLKYYYFEIHNEPYNEPYDYKINERLKTLYIVDTANEKMIAIFNELINICNNENNAFTKIENTIDLNKQNTPKDNKNSFDNVKYNYENDENLIAEIKKNYIILFLTEDDCMENIHLIEWIMNHSEYKRELYSSSENYYIIKQLSFLGFQIETRQHNYKNEKYNRTYIYISLLDNEYNLYQAVLLDYYKTYSIKNDKFFNYFSNNINDIRYEYNSFKFNNNNDNITDWLPSNVKYLKLNNLNYNFNIDNLSFNLKYLFIVDAAFNQSLDNLPLTLEYLIIKGHNFNKPLDYLPISLKYLAIESSMFNQPLDNLPIMLNYLHIESSNYEHNLYNLPSLLQILDLSLFICKNLIYDFSNLPDSIESLIIRCPSQNFSIDKLKIPSNIKQISFPNIHVSDLVKVNPHLEIIYYLNNLHINF